MLDCFRRIAVSNAGLVNDVIPFLARDANENLASETSRPLATSSLAHLNHDSLAKTFSPGIIVRSTCGKSKLLLLSFPALNNVATTNFNDISVLFTQQSIVSLFYFLY